jgi:hypothetical protein
VAAGNVGKSISVRVTATSAGDTTTKTTDGTTEVRKARFATAPKPKLVGTVATDQTVEADPGTWAAVPDSLAFSWKRNGKAIARATDAVYVVTPADTGKKLSVTVTARKAGYVTASVTSASTTVAKARFATVGVPTVTGAPVVGGTLTADPGAWAPAPGTAKLKKATSPTLKLTAAQAGIEVRVRVRAGRPGYRTAEVYSQRFAVTKA